jgi:hypothetical protein
VAFATVEYAFAETMLFRFRGLREFRRHEAGEDQFDELQAAVALEAADPVTGQPEIPDYLLDDEGNATRRFLTHRRPE